MIRFRPSSMPVDGSLCDFEVIYNGRIIAMIDAPVEPDPDDATLYITQATGEELLTIKFEPPENIGGEDKTNPDDSRVWLGELAKTEAWPSLVALGRLLLDHYYPANSSGPPYVTALREMLADISKDRKA